MYILNIDNKNLKYNLYIKTKVFSVACYKKLCYFQNILDINLANLKSMI